MEHEIVAPKFTRYSKRLDHRIRSVPTFWLSFAAAALAAPALAAPPAVTRLQATPDEEPPVGPPRGTIFFRSQTVVVTVRPPPTSEAEARAMLSRGAQRCVRADRIAGATMLDDKAVELKMRGGDALRLTLAENCPVLGFYGGFYLSRQADRLCAGRDFLLARSGQRCGIAGIERTRVSR